MLVLSAIGQLFNPGVVNYSVFTIASDFSTWSVGEM
jgi:hypothetical protein